MPTILSNTGTHTSLGKPATISPSKGTPALNLRRGTILLDKYKILHHLGSGVNGLVFLARHLVSSHDLAVKAVPLSKCEFTWVHDTESSALVPIPAEYCLQFLEHDGIVRMTDSWIDYERQCVFLVTIPHGPSWSLHGEVALRRPGVPTDKVESRSLASLVQGSEWREKITSGDIVKDIFSQIVLAVQHMFSNSVIHRDLSLENILVDDSYQIKVADFGSAICQSPRALSHDVKGTSDYWPPEKRAEFDHEESWHADCHGHLLGPVEIYALGCILLELVQMEQLRIWDDGVQDILAAADPPNDCWEPEDWGACKSLIAWCRSEMPLDRPKIEQLARYPWLFNHTSEQHIFQV